VGASARTMRQISLLIESDPLSTSESRVNAGRLRMRAEKPKLDVEDQHGINQGPYSNHISEDRQYDNLVSPFYQ
jgi:hypothetical protein